MQAKLRKSKDDNRTPQVLEIVAFRGQRSMATWVIEVTEFKYEDRCDLRGHLDAAMASEATKIDVRHSKNTEK